MYAKNVKRWLGGSMVVRWVSAGIVEAEKKFRGVLAARAASPTGCKPRDAASSSRASAELVLVQDDNYLEIRYYRLTLGFDPLPEVCDFLRVSIIGSCRLREEV